MTNGKKIKVVLKPREYQIKIYGDWVEIEIQRLGVNFSCSLDWWNTEYKESTDDLSSELEKNSKKLEKGTAKNDLGLIHTWGLDEEIRCTMCTNSMKSDRGCDGGCVVNNAMYKKVMDVIENHIVDINKMVEPTTKNDLGVDCIDRKATLDAIIKRLGIKNEAYLLEAERVIYQQILAMPSVTPQETR